MIIWPRTLPFADIPVKSERCNLQNSFLQNAAMDFHERLRQARQRRFRTAKAASDFLGIKYGTLTGHEGGSRGAKRNEIVRYAKAYGVEIPWLEHGLGPETRGQDNPGPMSSDEELVLTAYRMLPPDEAAAHRDLLVARTGVSVSGDAAPTGARSQPTKRGRR